MKIENIIVHCSDSGFGDAGLIRLWHMQRGWKDIGYNAVILNGKRSSRSNYTPDSDGVLEIGRALDFSAYLEENEVGAHALGYNLNSVGVCLIGVDQFTEKQIDTLLAFLRLWGKIVPGVKVLGHYEVDGKKSCPNIDMDVLRRLI